MLLYAIQFLLISDHNLHFKSIKFLLHNRRFLYTKLAYKLQKIN